MNLNDIMGRKDAAAKGTPVEQYRKTIGMKEPPKSFKPTLILNVQYF